MRRTGSQLGGAILVALGLVALCLSALPAFAQYGGGFGPGHGGGWVSEMLEAHNAARTRVGVPPLAWSEEAAAAAQDWAQTLSAGRTLHHRPGRRFGENIYWTTGTERPARVVANWLAEERFYDPASGRCSGDCLHYTQVVWRHTRAVGCGVARSRNGEFWVCDYSPPGNFIGERAY